MQVYARSAAKIIIAVMGEKESVRAVEAILLAVSGVATATGTIILIGEAREPECRRKLAEAAGIMRGTANILRAPGQKRQTWWERLLKPSG